MKNFSQYWNKFLIIILFNWHMYIKQMKWNLIMNIIFQKLFLENEYQTAKCNTKSKVHLQFISQKFSLNFIYSVVLKHFTYVVSLYWFSKMIFACCAVISWYNSVRFHDTLYSSRRYEDRMLIVKWDNLIETYTLIVKTRGTQFPENI